MQQQEETTAQPTTMTIDARDADPPRAISMFFFFSSYSTMTSVGPRTVLYIDGWLWLHRQEYGSSADGTADDKV